MARAGRWELALNGPHKRLFSASLVLILFSAFGYDGSQYTRVFVLGVVNKVPGLSNGIRPKMLGRYVRLAIKECKNG